jgi:4-hydroxy-tetrahydrodipicolinate reductase
MGKRIAHLVLQSEDMALAGAVEQKDHPELGRDVGNVCGLGPTGIMLTDSLDDVSGDFEVIIDFASPAASLKSLDFAVEKRKAIVVGTTGFSTQELDKIREKGSKGRCLYSPNMSTGVNLMFKIIADVARVCQDDYDIEIVEAHHRMKKDAPSGTALKMAQIVASTLNRDLDRVGVFGRKGLIGQRSKEEIGIQVIRAGAIVGEHTVMFGGLGERIEIAHTAHSRDSFALGALKAARWLVKQPPGMYDMQDVLGLKD